MKKMFSFAIGCLLLLAATSASASSESYVTASIITPYTEWQYALATGPVIPGQAAWDSQNWQTGQGAFSNLNTTRFSFPVHTDWPTNTSLLLQKTITHSDVLTAVGNPTYILKQLFFVMNFDDQLILYINNHQMTSYYDKNFIVAYRGFDAEQLEGIWNQNGDNVIQIVGVDLNNKNYLHLESLTISAYKNASDVPPPTAPTPIPGALWLLGSGVAGLMAVARRKRRK